MEGGRAEMEIYMSLWRPVDGAMCETTLRILSYIDIFLFLLTLSWAEFLSLATIES